MGLFKNNIENECRFCPKSFCCPKCRFKHENIKHNLQIDCDICVYGRIYYRNISSALMEHIKEMHFPLHCLMCKQTFHDIQALTENHKCIPNYDSPFHKTAESIIIWGSIDTKFDEDNSSIPMVSGIILTTSTPVGSTVPDQEIDTSSLTSIHEHATNIEESSKKPPIIASVHNTTSSPKDIVPQIPLVTPLRSIIVKSKFQNQFGETSKERKVTFFNDTNVSQTENQSSNEYNNLNNVKYFESISDEDVLPSTPSLRSIITKGKLENNSGGSNNSKRKVKFLKSFEDQRENENVVDDSPSQYSTLNKVHCFEGSSYEDNLLTTPMVEKSDVFYTPQICFNEDSAACPEPVKTSKENSSVGGGYTFSSIGQLWTSMTNAMKNVFLQVATTSSSSDSIDVSFKRNLSPESGNIAGDRIKRLCIRSPSTIQYDAPHISNTK